MEVLAGMEDKQVNGARSRAGSCVEFYSVKVSVGGHAGGQGDSGRWRECADAAQRGVGMVRELHQSTGSGSIGSDTCCICFWK